MHQDSDAARRRHAGKALRLGGTSGRLPYLPIVLLVLWSSVSAQSPAGIVRSTEPFAMRVVTSGLQGPWEVTAAPDGYLWITERVGRRVVRLNPADGTQDVLLELPEVYQRVGQDGLLGLALHADFGRSRNSDNVYLAFTYDDDPGAGERPRLAVRRYRFDAASRRLTDPVPVLTGLPAHNDHVGGRLVFGPDRMLYLTIGDQGANFGQNRCNVNRAQDLPTEADVRSRDWSTYSGKILRVALDGSIPADNPRIDGVRSHVFSSGHRNPLGLVFGPGDLLYESEHGPETDDEVNLIEAGRNYGWPHVAGFRDDKTYVYANWSRSAPEACASLPGRGAPPAAVPIQRESSWTHPQFTPPLRTFFTFDSAADVKQAGGGTIAPGGLDIYTSPNGVPGWNTSLLVLGMLKGAVYRVPLAADGRSVREPPVQVFKTTNRYRDMAVGSDGRTFYLATDPSGRAADDNGVMSPLANPGSILEFRYTR